MFGWMDEKEEVWGRMRLLGSHVSWCVDRACSGPPLVG